MTHKRYQLLSLHFHLAAGELARIESDRKNLRLSPEERPSDEELQQAEDNFIKLAEKIDAVKSGQIVLEPD